MSRNSTKRSSQQTTSQLEVVSEEKIKKVPKKAKLPDPPVDTESLPSTSVRRPPPTRENIESEFDELIALINSELESLRTSPEKIKGSRFLRTIGKRLKTLKTRSLRITKQKNGNRRNNANSGFLKPVPISKELATFTSWSPADLHSRVDVTKFICTYVKEHDLQDPQDRRRILVDKNPKLKALLGFQGESPALRYCDLQTHLKQHFPVQPKPEKSVATRPEKPIVKAQPETVPAKPRKARA